MATFYKVQVSLKEVSKNLDGLVVRALAWEADAVGSNPA